MGKEKKRVQETVPVGDEPLKTLPMVAMNGGIPCAAALYTDARMNDQNTFFLGNLIRNAGENCRGAGAAILCHLIRNSVNRDLKFSPLKLKPILNEPKLEKYYESFGCTKREKWITHWVYHCDDPNPQKCKQYADGEVFQVQSEMQTIWR